MKWEDVSRPPFWSGVTMVLLLFVIALFLRGRFEEQTRRIVALVLALLSGCGLWLVVMAVYMPDPERRNAWLYWPRRR